MEPRNIPQEFCLEIQERKPFQWGARGVEVNSTEYANKLNEAKTEL